MLQKKYFHQEQQQRNKIPPNTRLVNDVEPCNVLMTSSLSSPVFVVRSNEMPNSSSDTNELNPTIGLNIMLIISFTLRTEQFDGRNLLQVCYLNRIFVFIKQIMKFQFQHQMLFHHHYRNLLQHRCRCMNLIDAICFNLIFDFLIELLNETIAITECCYQQSTTTNIE